MIQQGKKVMRTDSIPVNQTFFTSEGYLIDHPILTSVGLFEYRNNDGTKRVELRLPEEVFKQESLDSYEGKPIIITHNAMVVDKRNVGRESIGTILSKAYQDGDDVRAKIIIHNTDAMKDCGLKELSLGYTLDLDETPGEWQGQHYDCIQRNIVVNHLALVRAARAGDQARLNIDNNDSEFEKGEKLIMAKQNRNDTIDNPTKPGVEPVNGKDGVTDAEKAKQDQNTAVTPDQSKQKAVDGAPEDIESAIAVIAEKDKEIESLKEELEALKAEKQQKMDADNINVTAPTPADPADTVKKDEDDKSDTNSDCGAPDVNTSPTRQDSKEDFRELLKVVRIGDKLHLDGLEELSIIDAKKKIIKKVKPKMNLDGKSEEYVSACFDMAVEEVTASKTTDDQRKQMTTKLNNDADDSADKSAYAARERMIQKRMKGV